jgi:hypothetical protein
VGLTYDGKERFRGRVLAEIGEPFEVAPWLTPGGAADADAVRALTDEIGHRLRHVTLNLTAAADRPLVEAADRMYTREKALHGFRERDPLTERVPRLRRFAEAMAWLRVHDPTRFQRLAGRVRRHHRLAAALGAEEGDVPDRYRTRDVLRYVLREGGPLLIAAPFALVGTVIWYPTWVAPRFVLRVVRPERESIATYKLATGFGAVPLTVLTATAVAAWLGGWIAAALAFVAAPLLGLCALLWRERWLRVREDARLFLRVLRRSGLRERIAVRRAGLVAEFDEILAEMDSIRVAR